MTGEACRYWVELLADRSPLGTIAALQHVARLLVELAGNREDDDDREILEYLIDETRRRLNEHQP